MARFVFRLAPVLRYRERIEDEKKLMLAGEQRKLAEAEAERNALKSRREALAREMVSGHKRFDAETLRMTYAHLDFLAREINVADWRVATCVQAVNAAREALVRASKDRKILDRLRERARENFNREEQRVEQRDLDEANSQRYMRLQHHQGVTTS